MIDKEKTFMRAALQQAQYALQENEVPVGAVIVYQDRIIAKAYNQVERLKDVTAHAEMIAITSAAEYIGGKYLHDCVLYVTLEPCVMCVGAIRHARFNKVVYGASDHRHILPNRWESLLPHTEIEKGLLAGECQKVLDDFFQSRRNLKA